VVNLLEQRRTAETRWGGGWEGRVFIHRQIKGEAEQERPVSHGSGDTLTMMEDMVLEPTKQSRSSIVRRLRRKGICLACAARNLMHSWAGDG